MQYPIKHTSNICLEKQIKHLKQMLATYIYNHCEYSISIYFCNIHMKHLQHTFETSETLENRRFQHALSANLGRRVGERSTAQRDLTLSCGGGEWSRDAAEEVGLGMEMATESAQVPLREHGRKEAWRGRRAWGRRRVRRRRAAWRGVARTGCKGRPPGAPGSAVGVGIVAAREDKRSLSWCEQSITDDFFSSFRRSTLNKKNSRSVTHRNKMLTVRRL
jgi:hypothetical protein